MDFRFGKVTLITKVVNKVYVILRTCLAKSFKFTLWYLSIANKAIAIFKNRAMKFFGRVAYTTICEKVMAKI
jgi:hypothetical protein